MSQAESILSELGVPVEHLATIRALIQAPDRRGWDYPWEGLEDLAAAGRACVVGYGSLLNPTDAKRTLVDTPMPEGYPPVIAFGARRVYNYAATRAPVHENGGPRAALNCAYTADPVDWFNGRLIPLNPHDVEPYRQREVPYHLRRIAVVDWHDRAAPPEPAYALCLGEEPWQGRHYITPDAPPHERYHVICRSGARLVSEEFLQVFRRTTWVADGRRLDEWEDAVGWSDAPYADG